ncbi:hypothetical protein P7C73_g4037, partial [Tremellales sp. Uapishka_1]
MSSSPPRRRYYDSRPSSRQGRRSSRDSRPNSPPSATSDAQVRSQAVAVLKRAASLPRRPQQPPSAFPQAPAQFEDAPSLHAPHYGDEEILSPSPVAQTFNYANIYGPQASSMQRSASASSSFNIPTPPVYNGTSSSTPFYSATSNTPDWVPFQVGPSPQGYHSPAIPSSPYMLPQMPGRSTPSPLPTLGELRTLQRSNSAAARAKAMSKLTGHTPPPDHDDIPVRVPLQRSDSLGAPRLLGIPLPPPVDLSGLKEDEGGAAEGRPRLQRSFTISSSNPEGEGRSAAGRKMVARLNARKVAREQEEGEVRQLWEDRVGRKSEEAEAQDDEEIVVPRVENSSLVHSAPAMDPVPSHDLLAVAPRSMSRGTMRSDNTTGEAFEYEAQLGRSLSSRTAREAGTIPDIIIPRSSEESERSVDDEPLPPPLPPFATPTKHVAHSSTSTQGTIQGTASPGDSSTGTVDALNSMMFVLGGTSGPRGSGRGADGSWPAEVEESGGSDWGTPAKDAHVAVFQDSPAVHSPLGSSHERELSQLSQSAESYDSRSKTGSVMSWQEVGGLSDMEVPTDTGYHQKSDSVVSKIRNKMRKRSQSKSSMTSSSPPTSPRQPAGDTLAAVASGISRRASQASTSLSATARHQPSISSLAHSSQTGHESSANSILLQHQLENQGTSSTSFLPRAELSDPRIHSSKLSPFPGISQLEAKRKGETPKLIHQSSDSVIPSKSVQESGDIYALPIQPPHESRRSSGDSVGKRSWLSKALGQPSPRSSGSVSRKSSNPDIEERRGGRKPSVDVHSPLLESDPFALAAPNSQPPRHRSASPSVSVVPELSEEGSRLTRFTGARGISPNAVLDEVKETTTLPPRSMQVLNRMDDVLALGPDDPSRPEILDDPPRKLLLATQVLQVVNVHTVKDRYLFLFNDILVIAKPIITQGILANLNMQFVVKSVVSLDKLVISGISEEQYPENKRHPVVQHFIQQFAADPVSAVRYLVERSNPKVDPPTLASLLFKTPELDKSQIGMLLANNETLLLAFVDRFHFGSVRIDDALRMFLLSIRLPTEANASETLLRGFATRYFQANQNIVGYDKGLTTDLVLAIMQLNDALYGGFGFAFPNHAITRETFTEAFRSKDPRDLVPEDLLSEIYSSIRKNKLIQALASHESGQEREVVLTPAKLPSKLTYMTWSERIYVSLPSVDPLFKVKLLGEGLEFDPPLLDFSRSSEESFRVRGTSLGSKSMLFDRVGGNAALYAKLGNTKSFAVERAFMKHTFHLSFVNHLGSKRKYCISVNDNATRDKWVVALGKQIRAASVQSTTSRIKQVATAVSLQVLRDALIPPEEKPEDKKRTNRTGSVSVAFRAENGNATEKEPQPVVTGEEDRGGMVEVQTGKELVLLCRQNSLLPGLLELLQAGVEDEKSREQETVKRKISVRNGGRV